MGRVKRILIGTNEGARFSIKGPHYDSKSQRRTFRKIIPTIYTNRYCLSTNNALFEQKQNQEIGEFRIIL